MQTKSTNRRMTQLEIINELEEVALGEASTTQTQIDEIGEPETHQYFQWLRKKSGWVGTMTPEWEHFTA